MKACSVSDIQDQHQSGIQADYACATRIIELAHPGDRIVIMGARDDTLALFAGDLLAAFA